ncbi:MAG: FtsX-like permease family protein, partial [Eubacteriaceae bacterium]|nr:FtsX-like permease family protein [Eubacteriaceae bacterium]
FGTADPVGKTVEIGDEAFMVVGVIDTRSTFRPTIETMDDYYTYMGNSTPKVYLTIAEWPIVFQFDEPEAVMVRAKDTDSMTEIGRRTAEILNSALGISDTSEKAPEGGDEQNIRYKADDLLEQARQIQDLSRSTNSMLIWIAGISLLVGGIGVMNIMLVSVTERTKEIGIRKALGATNRDIRTQFIFESLILCLIGGTIGMLIGIGLAALAGMFLGFSVHLSLASVIIAVGFSSFIGVFFGYYPANKAAVLDPIDALRYE